METLTFLGTGGSAMTRTRMCSGILLGDKLFDVGVGVLANLVRSGVKLDTINDLYVSHVHSDHVGDFTGLVWAMAMERRTKPLRVVSSTGTAKAMREMLELQATPKAWVKFDVVFVRPEQAGVKSLATLHQPENLAYRFDTQKGGIVFVGDTARYEKISEFARECDLLIHDSMFLNGQESIAKVTNHSTAVDAAVTARDAHAGRLVLTHISPDNEGTDEKYLAEASGHFSGRVIVARDNLEIRL